MCSGGVGEIYNIHDKETTATKNTFAFLAQLFLSLQKYNYNNIPSREDHSLCDFASCFDQNQPLRCTCSHLYVNYHNVDNCLSCTWLEYDFIKELLTTATTTQQFTCSVKPPQHSQREKKNTPSRATSAEQLCLFRCALPHEIITSYRKMCVFCSVQYSLTRSSVIHVHGILIWF